MKASSTSQHGAGDRGILTVAGWVSYRHGRPIPEVIVCAYDVRLKKQTLLGQGVTSADGHYSIRYTSNLIQKGGPTHVALMVRAFLQTKEGAPANDPLAESALIARPKSLEEVNLLIDGTESDIWSEFDELGRVLGDHLDGSALEELDPKDTIYLATVTGAAEERVLALVKAHQLKATTGLPAEFFYGLLRAGLPFALPKVLQQSPEVVRHALHGAFDRFWIPWTLRESLEQNIQAFYEQTISVSLGSHSAMSSTLDALLEIVLKKESDRALFLRTYLEHDGTVLGFWEKLSSHTVFRRKVPQLQNLIQIAALTGGDVRLTGELYGTQGRRGLAQVDQLGTFTAERWEGRIRLAYPKGMKALRTLGVATEQKGLQVYAKRLATVAARMFPAAAQAHRFTAPDLNAFVSPELPALIRQVLPSQESDDLRKTHILLRLGSDDSDVTQSTVRELIGLQSLLKATTDPNQAAVLLLNGINSVVQIAVQEKKQFTRAVGGNSGLAKSEAETVSNQAQRIVTGALVLWGELGASTNQVQLHAVGKRTQDASMLGEWAALFQPRDLLHCHHCRSAFGPAAYFVEVLDFLRSKGNSDGSIAGYQNALDRLLERRPDLLNVELSCENTLVQLPYIDLVNEVLEEAVADSPFQPFDIEVQDAGLDSANLLAVVVPAFGAGSSALSHEVTLTTLIENSRWVLRDRGKRFVLSRSADDNTKVRVESCSRQTWIPSNIRPADPKAGETPQSNPQHTNLAAYEKLRRATGGLQLPLDLWLEQTRVYLEHLGVPRYQLMEILREEVLHEHPDPTEGLRRFLIAVERVGFTAAEWQRMSSNLDPDETKKAAAVWGLSENEVVPDPAARVDYILSLAGLGQNELEALLRTAHVGQSGNRKIDTSEPKFTVAPFDAEFLSSLHDFVRLWRRLDWKVSEVDGAILALRGSASATARINDEFILQLADMMEVRSCLATDLPTTFSIVENIRTQGPDSTYAKLFLPGPNPLPGFKLEGTEPKGGFTETDWSQAEATLRGAFKISSKELRAWLKFTDSSEDVDPTQPVELTLGRLSAVRRAVALARSLKLPADELVSLIQLSSSDPIRLESSRWTTDPSSGDTRALLELVRLAKEVEVAGFKPSELLELLTGNESPEYRVDDLVVGNALAQIRQAAVSILSQHEDADPSPNTVASLRSLALELGWSDFDISRALSLLDRTVEYRAAIQLEVGERDKAKRIILTSPPGEECRIRLDEDFTTLLCTGPLSAAEHEALRERIAAPSDLTQPLKERLSDALQELFQRSRSSVLDAHWWRTGATFRTYLAQLPSDLDLNQAVKRLLSPDVVWLEQWADTISQETIATLRDGGEGDAFSEAVATVAHLVHRRLTYLPDSLELQWSGDLKAREVDLLLNASQDEAFWSAVRRLKAKCEASIAQAKTLIAGDRKLEVLDAGPTTNARLARFAQELLPELAPHLVESAIIDAFSNAASVKGDVVREVLCDHLKSMDGQASGIAPFLDERFLQSSEPPTPDLFPAQFAVYRRAMKALRLTGKLGIDPVLLRLFRSEGAPVDVFALNSLPVKSGDSSVPLQRWRSLAAWPRIARSLHGRQRGLSELLILAAENRSNEFWTRLGALTEWQDPDIEALANSFSLHENEVDNPFSIGELGAPLTNLTTMREWHAWHRLQEAMQLLGKLGATAQQGLSWVQPWAIEVPSDGDGRKYLPDAPTAQQIANETYELARAKHSAAEWPEVAKRLRNPIRQRQREALVDYLLRWQNVGEPKWSNENDLYAHFLLDVKMEPMVMTTRLKQAISSAQLFVQRCFLNVETDSLPEDSGQGDLPPSHSVRADDSWRAWRWMKRYRVWEASRKILLFPENWLEPELRDDKTPFFEDLEGELLQNDLTEENVEDAVRVYLEKLHDVANLEVVATYEEQNVQSEGSSSEITHVFARSRAVPPIYYHRTRVGKARWTPWRRLELDIDADQLVPVVWNRRLHLFWPVFTEVPGNGENAPPLWKVQLAWSEHTRGRWTPKKLASGYFTSDVEVGKDRSGSKRQHVFLPRQAGAELSLWLISYGPGAQPHAGSAQPDEIAAPKRGITAEFRFKACGYDCQLHQWFDWKISVIPVWQSIGYRDPYRIVSPLLAPGVRANFYAQADQHVPITQRRLIGTWPDGMKLVQNGSQAAFLPQRSEPDSDAVALIRGPGEDPYTWLFSSQDESPRGCFFQDPSYSFFVTPKHVIVYADKLSETTLDAIDHFSHQYFADLDAASLVSNLVRQASSDSMVSASGQSQKAYVNNVSSLGLLSKLKTEPEPLQISQKASPLAAQELPFSIVADKPMTSTKVAQALSGYPDIAQGVLAEQPYVLRLPQQQLRYTFELFQHPFACDFIRELKAKGVDGLYEPSLQQATETTEWFKTRYVPTSLIDAAYPQPDVDFSYMGAYSAYNWEIFFHVPLLVARRLTQNQNFEEAQKWLHRVFNPTDTSSLPAPQRYWQCKPLRQAADPEWVKARLDDLAGRVESGTPDPEFEYQVRDWQEHPFNPHAVARMRLLAYQRAVVMQYLDNLIDWADNLFRQDAPESVEEATQLYVLAANLLGPRPVIASGDGPSAPPTPADLESFPGPVGTLLESLSTLIPMSEDETPIPHENHPPILGHSLLHFCVPANEKLLSYWDTIEDRLFKLRNSLNIDGVRRSLAMFSPPIDPALLVRAAAAGMDLSQAISDLYAPRSHYRFEALLGTVEKLVAEVKSLGASLLSALEKRDAEAVALLRSGQEIDLLKQVREVRKQQIDDAKVQLDSLRATRAVTEERRNYYRDIDRVTSREKRDSNKRKDAQSWSQRASGTQVGVALLAMIPQLHSTWPPEFSLGGIHLAKAAEAGVGVLQMIAAERTHEANMASIQAGHDRRWGDWKLQERLAEKELAQIDKQILGAEIRVQLAEKELSNHEKQIENAQELERFMRDKFTNKALYDWMVGQISAMHFQAYRLAYDWAKRLEKSYKYELGGDRSFIEFGQWDSLRKGLLAGERLERSIHRLEMSYKERNAREQELTKHVSLLLTEPEALLRLKQEGACDFRLTEDLFDQDYPGHYRRRIRSVSITIPAIVGPYSGIQAKLTLLSNWIRETDALPGDKYSREEDGEDPRFTFDAGGTESISTSHGNNDSGLHEFSFRDERYLPFEGAGVDSLWRLQLPKDTNHFDFESISDIVLHIKYTARDGGERLAAEARKALPALGSPKHLLSLRHNFPDAWYRLEQGSDEEGVRKVQVDLSKYLGTPSHANSPRVVGVTVVLVPSEGTDGSDAAVAFGPVDQDADTVQMALVDVAPLYGAAVGQSFPRPKDAGDIEPKWVDVSPGVFELRVKLDGSTLPLEDAYLLITIETRA